MGIGKNGFYTTKDICEQNATYNIILSGRGAGKSYAIAYEKEKDNPLYTGYLWRAWETKKCTVAYLRRFNDDVKASLVEDDFADKDITKIWTKATTGYFNDLGEQAILFYVADDAEDFVTKQ